VVHGSVLGLVPEQRTRRGAGRDVGSRRRGAIHADAERWRLRPGRDPLGAIAAGRLHREGVLVSVQPRIRLDRSFDERTHSYLGYVLGVRGSVDEEEREFLVAIGKGAQEKHAFRVGDRVRGQSLPVDDPRLETAEYFKTSGLEVLERAPELDAAPPPWHGVAPALPVYRERGHRRLDARTCAAKCSSCQWGCKMAVVMTVDHWIPRQKKYRTETFCYGPLSCPVYRAGPTRKVPGRRGMSYDEEDWIDEEATSHRGPDD
jgi:hypothetical protein